jgi:hypothetical protein
LSKQKQSKHGEECTARQRIHKLLRHLEVRLESEQTKATVADYVRLLQLERELDENEGQREIKVSWVDPKDSSVTGK